MLEGLKSRRDALLQEDEFQESVIDDFTNAEGVDYALTIQCGLAFWKRLEIKGRLAVYDLPGISSENLNALQAVLAAYIKKRGRIIAGLEGQGEFAEFLASAAAQEAFYVLSMIDVHIKAIKAAEAVLDDDAPEDDDSDE